MFDREGISSENLGSAEVYGWIAFADGRQKVEFDFQPKFSNRRANLLS